MTGLRPRMLRSAATVLRYAEEELAAGIAAAAHPWHWPVLATGSDARVVVSRAYDATHAYWRFYSDRRAAKVTQLQRRPTATALFYHGPHRTQLRIGGTVRELIGDELRHALWEAQTDDARANYATVHPPGTPLDDPATALPTNWPDDSSRARAYDHFGVYELQIERYDFLQLSDHGSRRSTWSTGAEDFGWLVP